MVPEEASRKPPVAHSINPLTKDKVSFQFCSVKHRCFLKVSGGDHQLESFLVRKKAEKPEEKLEKPASNRQQAWAQVQQGTKYYLLCAICGVKFSAVAIQTACCVVS